MQSAPSIAIDLPLKILIWEDSEATVWASYNSAEYLQQRHDVPRELLANIKVVETFVVRAAE